jgi:putative transposase
MKKSKFTEQQIAFALQHAESGTQVGEVCRKMGISEATFYRCSVGVSTTPCGRNLSQRLATQPAYAAQFSAHMDQGAPPRLAYCSNGA